MIFSLFFMVVIGGIFAFCRNPLVPFWNKKTFRTGCPAEFDDRMTQSFPAT